MSQSVQLSQRACTRIGEIVSLRFPELLESNAEIALALRNPHDGALAKQINDWLKNGFHQLDVSRVRHELELGEISTTELKNQLGVSCSTIWRRLEQGTGSAVEWDAFQAQFAVELAHYTPANANEKFVYGYCQAISALQREINQATGVKAPRVLTESAFCSLYHAVACPAWQAACNSKDSNRRDIAARQIHQKVQTTFPSYGSATYLAPEQLDQLQRDWLGAFLIVIFCKEPRGYRGHGMIDHL
jgi:hypothetical protein